MKVYTRGGDRGRTALFGSGRVSKDDPRVCAYGEIDELNAWIGVAVAHDPDPGIAEQMSEVQKDLFVVGAILATPDPARRRGEKFDLDEARATALERVIDQWTADLPELKAFIVPGGTPAAATLYAARAVCRRAERAIVGLAADDLPPTLLTYVNRLSDFLFVAARYANHRAGRREATW